MLVGSDDYILNLLNHESKNINESLSIIEGISKKHNVDLNQIADLLKNKEKYVSVPVGLFRSKLGPLEALVRYLKDVLEYPFCETAKMLSRDETTIWTSYSNSMKKSDKVIVDLDMKDISFEDLKVKKGELIVPLSLFSERRLSILETLCMYLRENFLLSYHNIGLLLERNDRTIWTVVNRATKKLENE